MAAKCVGNRGLDRRRGWNLNLKLLQTPMYKELTAANPKHLSSLYAVSRASIHHIDIHAAHHLPINNYIQQLLFINQYLIIIVEKSKFILSLYLKRWKNRTSHGIHGGRFQNASAPRSWWRLAERYLVTMVMIDHECELGSATGVWGQSQYHPNNRENAEPVGEVAGPASSAIF